MTVAPPNSGEATVDICVKDSNGNPFDSVSVKCYDYDQFGDDELMGEESTECNGCAVIKYTNKKWDSWILGQNPDIYCVISGDSIVEIETERTDNVDQSNSHYIEVEGIKSSTSAPSSAPLEVIDLSLDFETSTQFNNNIGHQALMDFTSSVSTIQSWVILEQGKIVSEWYGDDADQNSLFHLWSGTKTVTAMLFFLLGTEKNLDMKDLQLKDLLPDWDWIDNFWDPFDNKMDDKGKITLFQLLTMTSGLSDILGLAACVVDRTNCGFRGEFTATNPRFVEDNSGAFIYLHANNILSYVFESLSGEDLAKYAQENLFNYLGINNFAWWCVEDRFSTPLHGLLLTTRDYAKVAQFALQKGMFSPTSESMLSTEWYNERVNKNDSSRLPLYSFLYHADDANRMSCAVGSGGKLSCWDMTKKRVYTIIMTDAVDTITRGQECDDNFCKFYNVSDITNVAGIYNEAEDEAEVGARTFENFFSEQFVYFAREQDFNTAV